MDHTGITTGCAVLPQRHHGSRQAGDPHPHDGGLRDLPQEHRHLRRRSHGSYRHHHRLRLLPQRHHRARQAGNAHRDDGGLRDLPQEHRHVRRRPHGPHRRHGKLRELSQRQDGDGKPTKHFVTTQPCESCHRTGAWIPVIFRHVSPTYPDHGTRLACTSCHTSNAQTVPWKFAAYKPDCAGCHAGNFKPGSHKKYEKPATVSYTVAELRDCTRRLPHLHRQHADNDQDAALRSAPGQRRGLLVGLLRVSAPVDSAGVSGFVIWAPSGRWPSRSSIRHLPAHNSLPKGGA